eukprot:bmy_01102T0
MHNLGGTTMLYLVLGTEKMHNRSQAPRSCDCPFGFLHYQVLKRVTSVVARGGQVHLSSSYTQKRWVQGKGGKAETATLWERSWREMVQRSPCRKGNTSPEIRPLHTHLPDTPATYLIQGDKSVLEERLHNHGEVLTLQFLWISTPFPISSLLPLATKQDGGDKYGQD